VRCRPGLEVIDFDAEPLGAGSFADVRRGTYPVRAGAEGATEVAFKIFRGSQALDRTMHDLIVQEARLGLRLQHPHLIELYGILEIPRHGLALVTQPLNTVLLGSLCLVCCVLCHRISLYPVTVIQELRCGVESVSQCYPVAEGLVVPL